MNRYALLIRLEAKPGKVEEAERLLRAALADIEKEHSTTVWYALRFGPSSFGIFDAFPDQEERNLHLAGEAASSLFDKAGELFERPPIIERLEVLAEKISMTHDEVVGPPSPSASEAA